MIPFFKENGFIRKLCSHCRVYYWTQDETSTSCLDAPCCNYDFIGAPPVHRKYSSSEMREKFLTYFERHSHKRIAPYPVVARWRNDLMFTIAEQNPQDYEDLVLIMKEVPWRLERFGDQILEALSHN